MQADTLHRVIECGGGVVDIINTIEDLNSIQNTGIKITAIIKADVASSSSSSSSSLQLIPMLPPSFILDMVCTIDSDLFSIIDRSCVEYWNGSSVTTCGSTSGNVDCVGSKRLSTSKSKQEGKRCKS